MGGDSLHTGLDHFRKFRVSDCFVISDEIGVVRKTRSKELGVDSYVSRPILSMDKLGRGKVENILRGKLSLSCGERQQRTEY